MKKKEASILGQRLAALRRKPHTNGSDFWKKVRREQERERKKLGISFERVEHGKWHVVKADFIEGIVWRDHDGLWRNLIGSSPKKTRLEAAKALLGEPR